MAEKDTSIILTMRENLKKIIKGITLVFGLVLIIFISFYYISFDPEKINWGEWGANACILIGIMIFGILMGSSIGKDIQQEKPKGSYQTKCQEYLFVYETIKDIAIYFSQFWILFKARKLREKKIEYLVDNNIDTRIATAIVDNLEKEDFVVGKMIINGDGTKIYVKEVNGKELKFKKYTEEEAKVITKIFGFVLDTYGDSYYLQLYDEGGKKINEAEAGKKIAEKIKRDKRNNLIVRIISALIVSIVWTALTIEEFTQDDPSKKVKAYMNLMSRILALITSFVSGYSTSVINVKDQARAIDNKTQILTRFKTAYDQKLFIPESYEQMIEREYKEDLEKYNVCEEQKDKV